MDSSGAGSGMAAAIPIWNLVWRRHTNLLKFGQLIFRKIIKIVARCQIIKAKCAKIDFAWGSAPDPAKRAYCYSAPLEHSWNKRRPTYNAYFTPQTPTRQNCLVLSASAVWNELTTSQDCRRQKISKLNMFSFLHFCTVSKCGVNWVLYCLDPVSNSQLALWLHTRFSIR